MINLEFDPDTENNAVQITDVNLVVVMQWSSAKGIGVRENEEGTRNYYIFFDDGTKAHVGDWVVSEVTQSSFGFKIYTDEEYKKQKAEAVGEKND